MFNEISGNFLLCVTGSECFSDYSLIVSSFLIFFHFNLLHYVRARDWSSSELSAGARWFVYPRSIGHLPNVATCKDYRFVSRTIDSLRPSMFSDDNTESSLDRLFRPSKISNSKLAGDLPADSRSSISAEIPRRAASDSRSEGGGVVGGRGDECHPPAESEVHLPLI
jgi:hypothetical protein